MRTVEIRRHAETKPEEERGTGSHLSQAGVDAARRLGAPLGPFDYVVASDVPWTSETALAMGFAVDECVLVHGDLLAAAAAAIGDHSWADDPDPFATWTRLATGDAPVGALGRTQSAIWRHATEHLPDGGTTLVVSHGGQIEPGLVVCFPDADHRAWGRPLEHLEGARLQRDGGAWVGIELLRDV